MTATLPHRARTTNASDVLRGLGAAIALAVFVVGVPVALLALAPIYLPNGVPTWDRMHNAMTTADDGTLLFAVIAAIAWLAWIAFTLSVLVELVASARRVHAPRLPLIGGMQHGAARLLATAGILMALTTTTISHAPTAHAVTTAAPERLDATSHPAAHPDATTHDPHTTSHAAGRPAAESSLPTITVERGDTLWGIAERHLGAGSRYIEIRDLNAGTEQPGGGRLSDVDWILPGWQLTLPRDATGIPQPQRPTERHEDATRSTVTVQPGDSLWDIATEHLGDGRRYQEIADLNRDRIQADGQTLRDADLIRPGWVLALPVPESPAPAPARPAQPHPQPAAGRDIPRASAPDDRLHAVAHAADAGTQRPTPTPIPESPPAQAVTTAPTAAQDNSPARTWFLGLTALGAAGVVGEIARRRHLQQRARRLGEEIPLPTISSPAARAERSLRAAATPISITSITTALNNLGCQCYDAGRELPRLGALLLDEDQLTLLLVEDDTEPPAPFTAIDARTWIAPTTDVAQQEPTDYPDMCMPYPLLVTLGHTEQGTLILNLEAAGALAITGDPIVADDMLRALVIEAATSQLCGQLCICLTSDDELASLASTFEPHRLRVVQAADQRGTIEAGVAQALSEHGLDDTLQARGDRQAPDTWLPVVFIEHELTGQECAPWSGAVVITRQPTDSHWSLSASATGRAELSPLGIAFTPQRLRADQLTQVQALLETSLPPTATTLPSPPFDATKDEVAIVRESFGATAPAVSAQARITIRVLGPVEIDGLPPTVGSLSPRMTELLVYLALHGPTTGADLDDVLWGGERIHPGTRNALVYRTRRAVGADVLPLADTDGRLRLGTGATTDWRQFQNHLAEADSEGAGLDAALELVRDRPFRGIGGAEYAWADYDIQTMTSAIADASATIANRQLQSQRPSRALQTVFHGMKAAPYSETLHQIALAAAAAAGGPSQEAELRSRLAALIGELDPELAP